MALSVGKSVRVPGVGRSWDGTLMGMEAPGGGSRKGNVRNPSPPSRTAVRTLPHCHDGRECPFVLPTCCDEEGRRGVSSTRTVRRRERSPTSPRPFTTVVTGSSSFR